MHDYNLRPLWDKLLVIYGEIAKIAQRHGLRFYANGGTILGALRHKGFIPWDDDLDLYMSRPDYERFVQYAQEELPAGFEWVSIETDREYSNLFGKVRIADVAEVERVKTASHLSLNEGIFVDVFALDGLPQTKIGMWLFCVKRAILRRAGNGSRWWGWLFGMGKDKNANARRLQSWYASHKYDKCKMVGAVSPYDSVRTLKRWWFKKCWFDSVTMSPFEGIEIPIPIGAHELMTNVFGDYMKYPPEENRKPSHQMI